MFIFKNQNQGKSFISFQNSLSYKAVRLGQSEKQLQEKLRKYNSGKCNLIY